MPSRSKFAVRFATVCVVLLTLAGLLAALLLKLIPPARDRLSTQFSAAFAVSTLLLLIGSVALSRARHFVRRERQRQFRRQLLIALASGTLFVSSQTYGLTCLIKQQPAAAEEAQAVAVPFVATVAALHAMHFVVAVMFLVYVTVNAYADRYDHEYYWGVTICMWFWHILSIVWGVVLIVMLIVGWVG